MRFLSFDLDEEELEELEDEAIVELWENDPLGEFDTDDEDDSDFDGFDPLALSPVIEVPAEALELGTYTDFDRLFDVLSLVSDQALDWEAQLVSVEDPDFDEPEVYDLFGADDDDDDVFFDDDEEDADDEDAGDDVEDGDDDADAEGERARD